VCADPRGFSQLTTSFFASESLGIRHTPLTISFLIVILVYFYTRRPKALGFLFVMSLPLMSMILMSFLRPDEQMLFLAPSVTFKPGPRNRGE
jgi:hypothetical protein